MSPRVTDQVLEEIRQRIDIVELVGSRVTLKRMGSAYKACCPFHHEKTPSFTVNSVRRTYHCFGCGAHGDIFKFLMQSDGMTFMDAVRTLADRASVPLDVETDYDAEARNALYLIHAELAAFYQRCLRQVPSAQPARDYLARRRLDEAVVEKFGIGYAPAAPDTLVRWGAKHGIDPERLVEAGLLAPPNDPRRPESYYDRFRGRLMFPICDVQGRVIAFSGRILDPAAHPAKYVNSPETSIFQKGRVLYALDKARAQIVRGARREAIVCEGQIDVIRCHASGFDTAVASQGTAFTAEHVDVLKRYADTVTLVFDGDAAGSKAALRTGALFLNAGLPVRVAALPSGEDPDSLLRDRGREAFQALLDAAVSITAFQVRTLRLTERDADSVDAVGRMASGVLETLAGCPSAVLRSHLLQEAAALLHLPSSALEEDLEKVRQQQQARSDHRHAPAGAAGTAAPAAISAAAPIPAANAQAAAVPQVSIAEFGLCELLVHHPEDGAVHDLVRAWLPLACLPHEAGRQVVQAALEMQAGGGDKLAELAHDGDPAVRQLLARVSCADSRVLHSRDFTPLQAAEDLVCKLWAGHLREERQALAEATTPDLERRRQELVVAMKRLSQPGRWADRTAILEAQMRLAGLTPPARPEPSPAPAPPAAHATDSAGAGADPAGLPSSTDLDEVF